MFIDFEGIDGSGKTTLSNRVANRLRQLGHSVCHAREGGALASPIAEKIRALTRDVHHLALGEHAELLLYAAREAQTLEEVIRPALARGQWVIADRYVYSHLALARFGRNVTHPALPGVLDFAADGVLPDLVIFVDVDPAIARARKRAGKVRDRRVGDGSRKGQAGAGLAAQVREGFKALAAEDPERWYVFDNTWNSLEEAEEALVQLVLAACERRQNPAAPRPEIKRPENVLPRLALLKDGDRDPAAVRRNFLAVVDAVGQREPALAAYLLSGLSGSDVDERRFRLSRQAADVVAFGLCDVTDAGANVVRHALKAAEPGYVAKSLTGLGDDASMNLRYELLERAPADVARSLARLGGPKAEALRDELKTLVPNDVLAGLAFVDDEFSWKLRAELAGRATPDALATSLKGLDTPRAWELRHKLLGDAPLAVVESLYAVKASQAYALRERFLKRAPRAVLHTLFALDDEPAHALREQVGARMREAVESAFGLDSERAWALRARVAEAWPGAVVKSLGPLGQTARGQALLFELLERFPGDVDVLRQAAGVLDATATQPALEQQATA